MEVKERLRAAWRLTRAHAEALGDGLKAAAFPMLCRICEAETNGAAYCPACRNELKEAGASACPRCASTREGPWTWTADDCSWCKKRSLGFDRALALGPYSGPIRAACLELKDRRNAWLAKDLADLVVDAHLTAFEPLRGSLVVPVPLHWHRRLYRGFDQAGELAARIARRIGGKQACRLRRVVSTPPLADRTRRERAKLMEHAFRVHRPAAISGRTIVLVDDIMTTGATCGSAARALKRAGAARVVAVVIARTEEHRS